MARYNKGIASNTPVSVNKKDSPINCITRSMRSAPIILRTPTSLARLDARAVDKFMKLIQAINWIRMAIPANMYNKVGLMGVPISY